MLKRLSLVVFVLFSFTAYSQEQDSLPKPKYWKYNGSGALTFNQISLTNWAAGGQSSVNFVTKVSLGANYNRGRSRWVNKLDFDYGVVKVEDLPFRKNLDILNFSTNYSYRIKDNFRITAFTTLLTQVAPGFNYQNDTEGENYISNFLAPGFVQQGLGLEYVRDSVSLSVTLSPLAVKHTLVLDNGVNPVDYGVEEGERARHEFGSFLKATFSRELLKNILVTSDLTLFSNYLEDPQNIDVFYQGGIEIVANKYVTVTLNINIIYDDDVLIPEFKDVDNDGTEEIVNERPALQLKEVFGAGLSYKF